MNKKRPIAIELEPGDGERAMSLAARLRHADLPPDLWPERAYLVRILDAVRRAAGVPSLDAGAEAWQAWGARQVRRVGRPRSDAFVVALITKALLERSNERITKSAAVKAAKKGLGASMVERTVLNELRRLDAQPRQVRDHVLQTDSEIARAFELARAALGKNQRRS